MVNEFTKTFENRVYSRRIRTFYENVKNCIDNAIEYKILNQRFNKYRKYLIYKYRVWWKVQLKTDN